MVFGRQPALWIGTIVSCILAVVSVLLGDGVISDALAGRITDIVTALGELLVLLAPIVTALVIRPLVTPVAAPKLVSGTVVDVTPPRAPAPGDAIAPYQARV